MIEDVLKEMKRLIDENIEFQLSRQDGKYGDGIVLQKPLTVQLGTRQIPREGFPAIAIIPGYADEFLYASQRKDVTHSIDIGVVVEDTDEDRCEKRLWRTLRAIENLMEIHTKDGSGPIIQFRTSSISYDTGPYGIVNESNLLKAGVLSSEIKERVLSFNEDQI